MSNERSPRGLCSMTMGTRGTFRPRFSVLGSQEVQPCGCWCHTVAYATMELHDHVVRREVVLPAERDRVWEELADADGLSGWLADEVDLDVREGAEGTARWANGTERRVVVDEVEPARRLALRWWADGEDATVVDLTLDEDARGTRL